MVEVTGELFQKSSGHEWEWRIPGFPSLPEEVGTQYRSRKFFFSEACWELRMYPNGKTKECEGWVSLYLRRVDTGVSLTVGYSIGVIQADGDEETILAEEEISHTFSVVHGWGSPKFLLRTDLVRRGADLAPSEPVTVTCTMKGHCRHSAEATLCERLWNTCDMLRGLLTSEEGADVTIKLKDGELSAHRWILKAGSEVFARMFATDMKESHDGEVLVPEADKDSFNVVLAYMYSGVPEGLSSQNMCEVYRIAHKYELGELVRLCVVFMKGHLSLETESEALETVCDVILLADVYHEKDLNYCAREFVENNFDEVVESDEWKTLKRENPSLVSELLEKILLKNASKIKSY